MYTVYCGRVCCNFSKLSDADYFARKNGTVVFGIARTENEKGVKMKMVASTMLTDAYGDYWSDGEKVEYLEALDGAIAEIEELGFETYAKRTLAKLKEMKEYCKEEIKEEAEFEGVCPYCGEYLEYDERSGEYECHECGYNGGYVPNEDRLEDY